MGRVGKGAIVTYSVTFVSRRRRRRRIGLASVILPNRLSMAPLVSPLFRPTHHPPGGTSGSALSFGLAWVILSLRGQGLTTRGSPLRVPLIWIIPN